MAAVGETAPAFTLPGTFERERRDYSLDEYKGTTVALVFYPGDNTSVCTEQLNTYTSEIDRFTELGAQLLAISPQSVESHEGFSCAQGGFAFPLLADEDKAVGELYGVPGPLGFYRRSALVIDRGGVIRYAHRSRTSATFRPTSQLVKAVREASA